MIISRRSSFPEALQFPGTSAKKKITPRTRENRQVAEITRSVLDQKPEPKPGTREASLAEFAETNLTPPLTRPYPGSTNATRIRAHTSSTVNFVVRNATPSGKITTSPMSFVDQALQILGDLGDNKRNLQALEQHRTRLVPFVGAGLSIPLGYPSWANLLKSLAPDDTTKAEVGILLKHYQYEEAAEVIAENLPPKLFRAKLKEAFDEAKLPKLIGGALAILPAFANSLVITTNLDRALEHAYAEAGLPFQSVLKGGDLHDASAAIQRGDRCLIKLHGDYEDRKPVLTLDAYTAAYGNADPSEPNLSLALPKLLTIALTGRPLLFLGCSLQSDRTVKVIARVVRGLGVEHFVLLSSSENTGERREQLRDWNIKPIFFPRRGYDKVGAVLEACTHPAAGLVSQGPVDAMVREVRARTAASVRARCGTVKILDMEQPISLGAVYTEVTMLERIESRKHQTSEELNDLLAFMKDRVRAREVKNRVSGLEVVLTKRRLVIYGRPGAGKTTFLKHLALECLDGRLFEHLVPVFVPLRDFADKGKASLADYVVELIGKANFHVIAAGRVFLLLDGIDEVRESDFVRVRRAVEDFVREHADTPLVVTCRIAARAYSFEDFFDVQMADFSRAQIKGFSEKWFQYRDLPLHAARFMGRLLANPPLLELCSTPLLLTLLCLVFEDRGDFDGSRARLYQEAFDTLLHKWDGKRGIERERDLSLEEYEYLLETIAHETFMESTFLMERKQLQNRIAGFLALPRGQIASTPEKVLHVAESQLGILVQRARDMYMFSHLTFHEFLTARRLARNEDLIDQAVRHFGDPAWREVWLMLANLKDPAFLFPRLKAVLDQFVQHEQSIQRLLAWAAQKTALVAHPLSRASRRANYVGLTVRTAGKLAIGVSLEIATDQIRAEAISAYGPQNATRELAQSLARSLTQGVERARALKADHLGDIERCRDIARDLVLDLAMDRVTPIPKAFTQILLEMKDCFGSATR